MAVSYVTLYLPDGTPLQVVAGTPLHELYLALAGFTTSATGGAPDIDLTTLRPMAWFMTPFGPQSVIEPATIAEFERRDYTPLTAQQAADYFAGVAAPVPYSLVTEAELAEALDQRDTQAIPDSRLPARLSDVSLKAAFARLAPGLRSNSAPPPPRVKTMISAFQAGHGWNKAGGGGTVSDDTTAWALGNQSLKIVTDSTQTDTNIRNTVGPTYDLTDANLLLWVKVSDVTQLKSLMIRLGDATFANRWAVQIGWAGQPYYLSGEWMLVSVSLAGAVVDAGTPARNNIALFQISVSDKGAPITVNIGGFAVTPIAPGYRQGVVSLTFDDNNATDYTLARPAMDKYGYGGTAYSIAGVVGTADRCSLAQLHDLELNSGWEIAGHANTLTAHNAGFPSLTAAALESELSGLKTWLLDSGFRGVDHFAYPGGQITSAVDAAVGRYFQSARTILGNFSETAPPGRLRRLRSFTASPSTSVASFTSRIDQAVTDGGWLILTFHDLITTGTPTANQFRLSDFQTVMDYLNTKGILVKPVGDVLRSLI